MIQENKNIQAQEQALREVDLKGNFDGFTLSAVDLSKVDDYDKEDNSELEKMVNSNVEQGTKYGILISSDNAMSDDANVLYALKPEDMNYIADLYSPDEPIVSKEVSDKAKELSKALQDNGMKTMNEDYVRPVELGINATSVTNQNVDIKKDDAEKQAKLNKRIAYERHLRQQGLER